MIDIHSHILPGVDDGARTLNESIEMLKIAIDQGVTTQVLTPHIRVGRFNNNQENLQKAFHQFQIDVDQANLNIKLQLGAECHIDPLLITLANQNAIPCLGEYQGKKTFLLEFPRTDIPAGSDNLVRWLINKNYMPIIVHPERNQTFLRHREKLQTLLDLGCPIQITASSLTGNFGTKVQQMSEALITEGKVSAIASDCHNLKGRSPDLLTGLTLASQLIPHKKAQQLVTDIPYGLCHKA